MSAITYAGQFEGESKGPDALRDRRGSRSTRIAARICMAASLIAALMTFSEGAWVTRSGVREIRGVERNVVYAIQKLIEGDTLYQNPNDFPYDVIPYTPLYYLAVATICRSLEIDFRDPQSIISVARGFSLACAILLFGLLYAMMRHDFGVSLPAAVVACCFAFSLTAPWYFVARPDVLMALLILASLGCALRAIGSSELRWGWLIASATLSVLAMVAKQSGVQAVGVIAFFLIVTKRFAASALIVVITAVESAIAALLGGAFLGAYIQRHIIGGLDNGIDLLMAFQNSYAIFFLSGSMLLVLWVMAVGSWLTRWRNLAPQAQLVAVAAIASFIYASLTALKVGSAVNYYDEFVLLATLCVAAFLSGRPAFRGHSFDGPTLIAVVSLYLALFLPVWSANSLSENVYPNTNGKGIRPAISRQFRVYGELAAVVRKQMSLQPPHTYVLSYLDGFDNLLPEYCVLPQKDHFVLALKRQSIDYSRLRDGVRQGTVRLIVTGGTLPSDFLGVPLSSYSLAATSGTNSVYRYNGK